MAVLGVANSAMGNAVESHLHVFADDIAAKISRIKIQCEEEIGKLTADLVRLQALCNQQRVALVEAKAANKYQAETISSMEESLREKDE